MIGRSVQALAAGALCLLTLLTLLTDTSAAGAASRVVLLRSPSDNALARQGTTLLRAELEAAGFEVVEVDGDPQRDLRQVIEATSARLQPVATFAMRAAPAGTAVELWLEDRVTGKLVIRHVDVIAGPNAAADLSVKAVELLRGSLLEIRIQTRANGSSAAPTPGEVTRLVASADPDRLLFFGQGVGVAAGGALLVGSGPATAYSPLLRLSWGSSRGTVFRLTAAGLGSSPEVAAVEGRARVQQTLVLADGFRTFRAGARLQPFGGAAAGVYRVRSEGTGVSPLFVNGAGTTTGAAAGVQGGVAVRFGNRLALVVDVGVLLAPQTAIRIASREVARTGGVAVMGTASICGAF